MRRPRSGILGEESILIPRARKILSDSALVLARMVVELAFFEVWAMQTYLTDVWKLGFTRAAAIINIWEGATKLFPILFIFLADAFLGHFLTLVLSSVVFCAGLDLLFLSNVLLQAKSTSTCQHQDPSSSCVSHAESALFYTALALIALGISGHRVSLYPFYKEQQMDHADDQLWESEHEDDQNYNLILVGGILIVVPLIGGIAFPFIKPWRIRFGIPVGFVNVATFIFLIRSSTYKKRFGGKGSPLTTFTRVFVASLRKYKSKPSSSSPSSPIYYSINPREMDFEELRSRYQRPSCFLYCIDRSLIKAALVTPGESLEEQKKNRWKLCTVDEAAQTKITVCLIPMWMMLISPGIVVSFANTYFQEQANHMNSKLGNWNVPPPMLLFVFKLAQGSITGRVYQVFVQFYPSQLRARDSRTEGIGTGIIFTVFCCLTAALVERRRLGAVRKQGGQENPVRVYWLLFQFSFLGGMNSILDGGISDFCKFHAHSSSILGYLRYFAQGFIGLGYMFAPVLVLIVGNISERVGRETNWFQHALNNSHLDRYYWVMTTLCALNLIVFCFVAQTYVRRQVEKETELVNGQEEGPSTSTSEGAVVNPQNC